MSLQPPERRLVTEATLPDYISEIPEIADEVAQAIERRNLVTASTVRRIVASDNPDTPIEDGDLLLVYEAPFRAFTDFTDITLDAFTQRYNPANWSIEDSAESHSGKVLRTDSTDHERRALSWDIVDDSTDIEIVSRFRAPASTSSYSSAHILRGTTTGPTTADGYFVNFVGGNMDIRRVTDGVTTQIASGVPAAHTVGDWYWLRTRAHGSLLMARTWPDGDPEPSQWAITVTDTDHASGWAGLFASLSNPQQWNALGVGLDGGSAPKEPM